MQHFYILLGYVACSDWFELYLLSHSFRANVLIISLSLILACVVFLEALVLFWFLVFFISVQSNFPCPISFMLLTHNCSLSVHLDLVQVLLAF